MLPLVSSSIATENQNLYVRHLVHRTEVKTYRLQVKSDWTIGKVKQLIERLHAVPVEEQRLLFKQKALQDHRTLENCAIGDRTIIQLVPNRSFQMMRRASAMGEVNPDEGVSQLSRGVPHFPGFSNLMFLADPFPMDVTQTAAPAIQPANLHTAPSSQANAPE